MTVLAVSQSSIPIVASVAERTTRYPTPGIDQRVFNKSTAVIERWNGSSWLIDFGPSTPGGALDSGLTLIKSMSTQAIPKRLNIQADQSASATETAEVWILPSPSVSQGGMNAQLGIVGKVGNDLERFTISQVNHETVIDSTANGSGVIRPVVFAMGGYDLFGTTGKFRRGQNAMILAPDASVRLRGSAQTVPTTGTEVGGDFGFERTSIYDWGDTGNSMLIIGTRQESSTDNPADSSVIDFHRGNVRKWLVGLNAGGANADRFDFFANGAVRATLTQAGVFAATAFIGDGSGLTGITGGGSGVPSTGGIFTGNVGFGGVTPTAPLHVSKPAAGVVVATFENTSASGSGAKFYAGNATRDNDTYSLAAKSADDSKRMFAVYGEEAVVQIGPTPRAAQWAVPGNSNLAPAGSGGPTLGVLPVTGLHIYNGPTGGDSLIMFVANAVTDASNVTYSASPAAQRGPNRQSIGLSGNSLGKIRMNFLAARSDGGWLMHYNAYLDDNSPWIIPADRDRPRGKFGWDSSGRIGMSYAQPYNSGASAYDDMDDTDFQLIFDVGGVLESNWGHGKFSSIGTHNKNRGLNFFTSKTTAGADYKIALQIEPWAGSAPGTVTSLGYLIADTGARVNNNLSLFSGGTRGELWFENLGGDPSGPFDGDVWFTGTAFKCKIGGLLKTFTVS
jgi:hypothetical protein